MTQKRLSKTRKRNENTTFLARISMHPLRVNQSINCFFDISINFQFRLVFKKNAPIVTISARWNIFVCCGKVNSSGVCLSIGPLPCRRQHDFVKAIIRGRLVVFEFSIPISYKCFSWDRVTIMVIKSISFALMIFCRHKSASKVAVISTRGRNLMHFFLLKHQQSFK